MTSGKPGIFFFDFSFDDDEDNAPTQAYGMTLTPAAVSLLQDDLGSGDFYDKFTEPLESKYGVHDWSSGPHPDVEGVGYTTYEVEKGKVLALMEEWRDVLVKVAGATNVGPVVVLGDVALLDDHAIYQRALTAPPAPAAARAPQP